MFRRSATFLLVIISFIMKSNSYDYQDQMKDYSDSLYQRSFTKEQPSRDVEPSNVIDLKMPGVHLEKVDKLIFVH